MVSCGHAFVKIEYSVLVKVYAFIRCCLLQYSQTPVIVCRETVIRIIQRRHIAAHHESLVADKHSLSERIGSQDLWRGKMTRTGDDPEFVYKLCVAIYNFRLAPVTGEYCIGITAKCSGSGEHIAGIKEEEIITMANVKSFVHGIVYPAVRLGENPCTGTTCRDCQSSVGGGTIYNHMFIIGEKLLSHRLKR